MAAQDPALLARLRRQGFGAVPLQEGLHVLASLLSLSSVPQALPNASSAAQPAPALVASPLLWPELLRASAGARAKDGFYAEFAPQLLAPEHHPARGAAAITGPSGDTASSQAALLSDSQRQAGGHQQQAKSQDVMAAVLAIVRQVLGAEVTPDQGLMEVRQAEEFRKRRRATACVVINQCHEPTAAGSYPLRNRVAS